MTNEERLKEEGIDVKQFKSELLEYIGEKFDEYMKNEIKPTLTEDEKVILRNICLTGTFYIERKYGTLKIHNKFDEIVDFYMYDNLFQFIKDGEEYKISELLGDD